MRGSSTVEFVETAEPEDEPVASPPPGQRGPGVVWADIRLRQRAAARRAVRPAAALPAHLDVRRPQPARVPALDRLRPHLLHEQLGRALRRQREDRQARLALRVRPLRRRDAGAREPHRLPVLHEQASVQQQAQARASRGRGDRLRRRVRAGALAHEAGAGRVVAARRQRPRLRRRLARAGVRARRADGPCALDIRGRRQDQGLADALGEPPLRRQLQGLPLRAERDDRQADLARPFAGPLRRPRPVLLDADRRLRPRLPRLDRRQGLLVRRDERRAALVEGHGRLRLLLSRRLAQEGLRRVVLRPLLRLRRSHGRHRLGVRCRRRDLRLADDPGRRRLLRHTGGADVRPRRTQRQGALDVRATGSTRRSSPTASGSISSGTRASMGWWSDEVRRDRGRPGSSARTSARRSSGRVTRSSGSTPSRTTTTRR